MDLKKFVSSDGKEVNVLQTLKGKTAMNENEVNKEIILNFDEEMLGPIYEAFYKFD